MATTIATNPPPQPPPAPVPVPNLESLARIDPTTLSQSELQALSLSSLSAFDLRSTSDLITPQIDPSLFNESSGSRRQTYSGTRRSQSSPTGRRRRLPGLLPSLSVNDVPDNADNRLIIDYLKQFIREDPKFEQVELLPPSVHTEIALPVSNLRGAIGEGVVRKRKRGRKPKVKVHMDECYGGMEIVNKNGVAVDLSGLSVADDPFAEELRRRTEGLQGEEELLGFLRDLEGQWGSRRKKRKIVDAAHFGDVLPLGWKLLLGLKRKDGRAWIYCRRYVRFNLLLPQLKAIKSLIQILKKKIYLPF